MINVIFISRNELYKNPKFTRIFLTFVNSFAKTREVYQFFDMIWSKAIID